MFPIKPSEWNELDEKEKVKRITEFNKTTDAWNYLGLAYSLGDLKTAAIACGVPVPTGFDKDGDPLLEGFE